MSIIHARFRGFSRKRRIYGVSDSSGCIPYVLVRRLQRGKPSNRGFRTCGWLPSYICCEQGVGFGFQPAASCLTKKYGMHPLTLA